MARDVPEVGDVGQGALELPLRQVEGVVVDGLGLVFKGLQQEADLAQVALSREARGGSGGRCC